MKTLTKLIVASALLVSLLPKANATVFDFTYTDTVSYANTPGISVGDTFTLHLYGDNGGSSTINQTWTAGNMLGFTINAGSYYAGSYSAVWLSPFIMQTDGSGLVSNVQFYGTDFSSSNTDNFGSWVGDTVFGGADFYDFYGRSNGISLGTFNVTSHWTVGPVGAVPESTATLSLMGLSLLGLALVRRRK